jgi:hypothetical protein
MYQETEKPVAPASQAPAACTVLLVTFNRIHRDVYLCKSMMVGTTKRYKNINFSWNRSVQAMIPINFVPRKTAMLAQWRENDTNYQILRDY